MQASPGLPRPAQRRSPGTDSGPPPSSLPIPGGDGMPGTPAFSAPRSSSGSARSQASKTPSQQQPDKQLSQIEKSVTHLLVATKQLLEMLTQWSRKTASEGEVSDIYVRLGYEFNLACRAFGAIGVDTSDLGPVPDLLRSILEDTLSQEASPQSLDRFLPRIRDIIINLLHGLKKKQARLRSRQTREGSRSAQGRHPSAGSIGVSETSLNQLLEDTPNPESQSSPQRPHGRRYGSNTSIGDDQTLANVPVSPPGGSFSEREASKREAHRATNASGSSSLSSSTMQNIPVLTPYAENQPSPPPTSSPVTHPPPSQYPRPPPTPRTNDAFGALQRTGDLERRASRRFSAYQIQKHLGASSNGVPVLPSQHSPIPNRGGDVRESMNAVRLRGAYLHSRQKSNNRAAESSPNRAVQSPKRIPGEINTAAKQRGEEKSSFAISDNERPDEKIPVDKPGQHVEPDSRDIPVLGGAFSGPPPMMNSGTLTEPFRSDVDEHRPSSDATVTSTSPTQNKVISTAVSTPPQAEQFTPGHSPPPGKELTLFLQYKSKIKKFVLPEGYADLTLGRLQLAFIEKFAWNTHNNGVDLPEIYVQDQVSGVRHELEDLNDVKDRSVLVLNVEALDEVKKHVDEGMEGIRRMIEGVRTVVTEQDTAIQRVSERQLEAAKDMALLAAAPPKAVAASEPPKVPRPLASGSNVANSDQLFELQNLRRDLAVLRQTYSNFTSDITTSMSTVRTKAASVKTAAVDASIPTFQGDAGRARVNSGKKDLAVESEKLVARVDDLQDLVEDLRKDVVTRGVRPLPRQLEGVGRDISLVTKELKKMQEFLKKEKPIWTKIWEAELQVVCEERDQLTMQEDLACDLADDLEKATQTFALVEQATKQQNLNVQNPEVIGAGVLRNVSRNIVVDPGVLDPIKAKDGVLGEVRALQPNHENRLEAIERAEKTRQKELETRRVGVFQKELDNFVHEGKLKKSGGVEEAERLRKARDERTRRDAWEHQQARLAKMEELEREADEADAADAAAATPAPEEEEPADTNGVDSSPVPENEEKPKDERPETPGT